MGTLALVLALALAAVPCHLWHRIKHGKVLEHLWALTGETKVLASSERL